MQHSHTLQLHCAGVLGRARGAYGGAEPPPSAGGRAAPSGLTHSWRVPEKLLGWSRSPQHPLQPREGGPPGTLQGQARGECVPNPTGPQACEQWGRERHSLAQGWIWPREEQRWVGAQAGSGGVPRGAGAGARVCMACAWRMHDLCVVCMWHLHGVCTHTGGLHVGLGWECVYRGCACAWGCADMGECMHTRGVCMRVWGTCTYAARVHTCDMACWCGCAWYICMRAHMCACMHVHGVCSTCTDQIAHVWACAWVCACISVARACTCVRFACVCTGVHMCSVHACTQGVHAWIGARACICVGCVHAHVCALRGGRGCACLRAPGVHSSASPIRPGGCKRAGCMCAPKPGMCAHVCVVKRVCVQGGHWVYLYRVCMGCTTWCA